MVVGWQTAAHMRTALVTDALKMAIDAGHVDVDAVFHSDRGNIRRRSSTHLPPRMTSVGAWAGLGSAGTTPPPNRSSRP
jgi:hypothetical protein